MLRTVTPSNAVFEQTYGESLMTEPQIDIQGHMVNEDLIMGNIITTYTGYL